MVFGLRHSYLKKFHGIYCFFTYHYRFVVKRHMIKTNSSQLLPQDLCLNLVKDFNSLLFVLLTLKKKQKKFQLYPSCFHFRNHVTQSQLEVLITFVDSNIVFALGFTLWLIASTINFIKSFRDFCTIQFLGFLLSGLRNLFRRKTL